MTWCPLLDIDMSGQTNVQWPPKYVQITVDSNSYASAMYVYDKKPRRYVKDNRTAHLTARSDKSLAYVTNNKRLYSTLCTVEANYWQIRSIARPLCDSRATCFPLHVGSVCCGNLTMSVRRTSPCLKWCKNCSDLIEILSAVNCQIAVEEWGWNTSSKGPKRWIYLRTIMSLNIHWKFS